MTFRIPPRVAWYVPAEQAVGHLTLYLIQLPDGEPLVLTDVAAQIWIAAGVSDGAAEVPDVVQAVAEATGEDSCLIEDSVLDYLAYLVDRGLLLQDFPTSSES